MSPRRGLRRSSSTAAADTRALAILQSELQRNFQTLKQQHAPAYFISYTLHDHAVDAPRGVLWRRSIATTSRATASPPWRCASATTISTTRIRSAAIRGPWARASPASRCRSPTTSSRSASALWRATDRTFKQASEALIRVKTNVAAKVKEEDPAPDFSREDPQTYTGDTASYSLDTKAWEARLRRISAPFAEDPLVFRSNVSLSVDLDNRYYTNSEGAQIVTGDVACRLFIQAVDEGRRRDGAAAVPELLRQLAVRAAGRETARSPTPAP